ncbi:MAG: TolC family protein, partial [Bacteroidales bacterium]
MRPLKYIILFTVLVAGPVSLLRAQEVYRLDLNSSIAIARNQSNRMQILRQSLNMAHYQLKAATSSHKTHVNLDMILPRYTETVRQWEDSLGISFYPVKLNQMNAYLTVNQPLPTDGYLFLSSGLQNVIDYNFEDRLTQVSTSIGLRQPIEAFYGYNKLKLNYKQAQLNYESSLKQFERAELDLVYEISSLYYNLLSYEKRFEIAQMGYERQSEAFNIASNKYRAGLIREVESLQMEVDLSEAANRLDLAMVNYSAQMRLFKEVMGLDLRDSIIIESDLSYTRVFVNVEMAVQRALENRNELKEDQIQIELSEMEIKRRKAAGRIQGDIIFNYDLIGTNKSMLVIPLETSFQNSWYNLQDRPGNFNAALTISIPLIDWGENKARVNAARARLEQNKLQLKGEKITIEREIRTLIEQLNSSLRRLELLEKNVLVAEKSFEISRQRYSNGEIDSQAIALERERLNNAYISRLESFISYKLLLSDLMRKTYYDFEGEKEMGGG